MSCKYRASQYEHLLCPCDSKKSLRSLNLSRITESKMNVLSMNHAAITQPTTSQVYRPYLPFTSLIVSILVVLVTSSKVRKLPLSFKFYVRGIAFALTLNSKSSSSKAVFKIESIMNYGKRLVEKGAVVFT